MDSSFSNKQNKVPALFNFLSQIHKWAEDKGYELMDIVENFSLTGVEIYVKNHSGEMECINLVANPEEKASDCLVNLNDPESISMMLKKFDA
ncbi:MAG: hypothetical protein H6627_10750 [Calditrichae bacterium]|nr:hypothetical protein [Calditrichia bacterium]